MSSLLDNLQARRNAFNRIILTGRIFLLQRTLVGDGYGTKVEKFEYKGINFPGRLQPIFRRPDGTYTDAVLEMGDLRVVYPADIIIDQADRLQINNKSYSIRNIYDNVDDAMTNQCYVSEISGDMTYPPVIVP